MAEMVVRLEKVETVEMAPVLQEQITVEMEVLEEKALLMEETVAWAAMVQLVQ